MAANYYTGTVASFTELRTQLVTACAEHGWSWDGTILSKDGAFLRPYVSTTESSTEGAGLLAELGTGRSGNTITGNSGCIPRLGRNSGGMAAVTFPAVFHLAVFDDPNEVFLILQFNVNRHYFLAFGTSALGGGAWITATSKRGFTSSTASNYLFLISPTAGGNSAGASSSGLPFWKSSVGTSTAASHGEMIRTQMEVEWAGLISSATAAGFLNGVVAATPMMQHMPSAWSQASVLLPINVYQFRSGGFWSLALSIHNARYLRIDAYEPGQIITLGHEQWMVFPGHKKDLANRDAGTSGVDHTGTMGWAIRYQPEAEE